ncbi:MAG: tRNA preQ1(34) S-adenosylmethionine ribosyltransferase-isomerase QueA [Pseudomonadota bacterium]
MRRQDFHYDLPDELIAQSPAAERSASRLLDLRGAVARDAAFIDLPALLNPGDCLVFNDTRVVPARLLGEKASGGRVEVLVERIPGTDRRDEEAPVRAFIRASKAPKPGARLWLEDVVAAEVVGREGGHFLLRFDDPRPPLAVLEAHGRLPLPPYITREPEAVDDERYQTRFAEHPGAVAAPTAGLHFDDELMTRLAAAGIATATVTLHVGAGTFEPVRVEDLDAHRMHSEFAALDAATAERLNAVRAAGGRVVAVGTTSLRVLESAGEAGRVRAFRGETDIFIRPGYAFGATDALITNFHLPESTLMMLVCAFGGHQRMLDAYAHAVAARYRFFSYGDAMLIHPDPEVAPPAITEEGP